MIGALMRRDAALRFLGRWMFVGPLLTLTMMGVVASIRYSGGPGAPRGVADHLLIVLTMWLPAALYVGVNAAERRCSRFDMELPVSTRELWVARTAAMSVAGLALLAVTAAMLTFVAWAAERWAGVFPRVFSLGDAVVALKVAPVVLLGVALAQSVSPSLERIPQGRRLAWTVVAALTVLYGVCLVVVALHPVLAFVPLAAAAVLLAGARRELGGTMLLEPLEPGWFARGRRSPARGVAATAGAVDGAPAASIDAGAWSASAPPGGQVRRFATLLSTIYRGTTKFPVAPVVAIPVLIAAGATMAGAFGSTLRGDDSIRFSMLFIISYTLLSFSGLPPRKLYVLDALPVSRRFIFAAMFVPYIALLGLGYGAGRIVADRAEAARELMCYCAVDGHYYLSVPLRNGGIALDGRAPDAVAPWGESHEVWSRPVWSTGPAVVHSLYSTPPGSSPEFVAWQISRAVRDLYGADLPADEVRDRYLAIDERGSVVPSAAGFTLAADHPEWRPRPHGPVFPVMMLFVCGLWFLAMSVYLSTLRPGFTERRKRGAFWWGMVILMALHVSQFAALITDRLDHWVLSGTGMIAVRALAERLPGGSATVWVMCAVLLYLLYRLAESRFLRVESSPGDDMRITLIERPLGAAAGEGAYAR